MRRLNAGCVSGHRAADGTAKYPESLAQGRSYLPWGDVEWTRLRRVSVWDTLSQFGKQPRDGDSGGLRVMMERNWRADQAIEVVGVRRKRRADCVLGVGGKRIADVYERNGMSLDEDKRSVLWKQC